MTNLLKNPSFEGLGSYQDGIPELYAPDNWRIWWHSETKRPEAKVIKRVEPFLDPPRIYDGNQAVQLFTFSSRQHAGLSQVVTGLEPGAFYRLSACAHAWSAHKDIGPTPHDAHCSAGVGCGPVYIPEGDAPALNGNPENDAIGNFTFCVGAAFGERDSMGVVWGRGAHIYNAYTGVLPMRFKAPSNGRVVVYLSARSIWGFENSDAYWDKAELVRIDDIPPDPDPQPPQRGQPREQYERTYVLLPQDCDEWWFGAAADGSYEKRWTVGFSADDAGIGDLDKRRVIAVNPDQIGTGLTAAWYEEHYPGVEYTPLIAQSPDALELLLVTLDGPPPIPDPDPPPDPPAAAGPFTLPTLHLQRPFSNWLHIVKMRADLGIPFQWIFLVHEGMENAVDVKRVSPETKVVFRHVDDAVKHYHLNPDPYAAALEFWGHFGDGIHRNPIDAVCSLNETIATHDIEGIRQTVEFDCAFAEVVYSATAGKVAPVTLIAPPGNPDHGVEVEMLVPVVRATLQAGGMLGPHTYIAARPEPDITERWLREEGLNYHMRPCLSWDPVFTSHGLYPTYLFLETGVVGANIRADGRPGGFADDGAGWKAPHCLNGDLNRYLRVLVEYDAQVNAWNADHGNRVQGWMIFTSGNVGWEQFQFNEHEWLSLLERLP